MFRCHSALTSKKIANIDYLKRETPQLDNVLLPRNMVGNFYLDLHRLSLKINVSSFATTLGNYQEHKELNEIATTTFVIFVPFVVENYPMSWN